MPPKPIYDISGIDLEAEAVPIEELRAINPQRFEFEQLTRIVHIDDQAQVIVGVKDVDESEFWVRGHIPGRPLFPGVLMCEAAAQLSTFYYKTRLPEIRDMFVAFGGLDKVRFRGTVSPGDRLVIIGKVDRIRARQAIFDTQGLVDGEVVFSARVIGIPMGKEGDTTT